MQEKERDLQVLAVTHVFSTPSHGNKPFLDRRKKVVEYVFLFFLSFSLACLLAPSPVENDRK